MADLHHERHGTRRTETRKPGRVASLVWLGRLFGRWWWLVTLNIGSHALYALYALYALCGLYITRFAVSPLATYLLTYSNTSYIIRTILLLQPQYDSIRNQKHTQRTSNPLPTNLPLLAIPRHKYPDTSAQFRQLRHHPVHTLLLLLLLSLLLLTHP